MRGIKYGTLGFLSAIVAMQLSMSAVANEKVDRTALNAKKSARSAKRDIKKGARQVTGQGSVWKDMKDGGEDTAKNIGDEAKHAKKHLKSE